MKFKSILTIAAMAMMSVTLNAENGKPRIYVEEFSISNDTRSADAGKIRQAIVDALTHTRRFEVLTEGSNQSVMSENERRSSEAAMNDEKSRTSTITSEAFDYILKGDIHSCKYSYSTLDDGTRSYSCLMNYSLTAVEVESTTTIATQQFDNSTGLISGIIYSGSTEEEALTNALKQIEKKIVNFVIENFPLEGTIIPSDFEVKKDKVTKCYIDLGGDDGVKVGDIFTVLSPKIIIGNVTYNETGSLKVEEVVSGNISLCKVTSGSKEIFQALEILQSLDEQTQKEQPVKIKSKKKFDTSTITNFI